MSDAAEIQSAVSTAMAGVLAEVRALSGRLDSVATDAREGRDATIKIQAQMEGEKLGVRIGQLETGFRSDLQTAVAHARNEAVKGDEELKAVFHDLEARVNIHHVRLNDIEKWRNRADGATGLLGWLSKWAPWLLNGALGSGLLYMLEHKK